MGERTGGTCGFFSAYSHALFSPEVLLAQRCLSQRPKAMPIGSPSQQVDPRLLPFLRFCPRFPACQPPHKLPALLDISTPLLGSALPVPASAGRCESTPVPFAQPTSETRPGKAAPSHSATLHHHPRFQGRQIGSKAAFQ